MPTSEEDLAAKAADVQKLRDQVAAAETKRLANEQAVSNDLAMANLQAEEARLSAQLASATAGQTVTAVREGAATPLASAKEQMEVAKAQQKAAEKNPETAANINTASDTVVPPSSTAGTTGPDITGGN